MACEDRKGNLAVLAAKAGSPLETFGVRLHVLTCGECRRELRALRTASEKMAGAYVSRRAAKAPPARRFAYAMAGFVFVALLGWATYASFRETWSRRHGPFQPASYRQGEKAPRAVD